MLIGYSFTSIAVSVRRWFEVTPEAVMEHGARVELGLLTPQRHRGTASAAQKTVIDNAFWRADLFGRLDRPADSYSAARCSAIRPREPDDMRRRAERSSEVGTLPSGKVNFPLCRNVF